MSSRSSKADKMGGCRWGPYKWLFKTQRGGKKIWDIRSFKTDKKTTSTS